MPVSVAFDIDDTLYKIIPEGEPLEGGGWLKWHQSLDYEMINLLRWYQKNGDRVIVWSAGGIDYATNFVNKFGLQEDGPIDILEKKLYSPGLVENVRIYSIDICYDDQEVTLAKVNIRVRR